MNRGYCVVALDNPKSSINVGSVLRLAFNYRVGLVVTSGHRYEGAPTDTLKGARHLPLLHGVADIFDYIPYDCVPVAVDIVEGARALTNYTHPERAFYVFGAEDATLGDRVLSRCRDVIYVPTRRCLNLAVAVGTVLYDRMAKEQA